MPTTTMQTTVMTRQMEQQQRLDALQAQRNALTTQLESQTARREYLSQQLGRASGQAASDIQSEIAAVDASVKGTTDALGRVDDAVNKAVTSELPAAYASQTAAVEAQLARFEQVAVKVGVVGVVGVAAIIVMLIQSFRRRPQARGLPPDDSIRFDQLQRAVDVIAVEVERISEAQRFMAKNVVDEKRIER